MAAKPKLTPDQWAVIRKTWEADRRDGYAWLARELSLPVSAQGVRKAALKSRWAKLNTPVSTATMGSDHAIRTWWRW